MYSGMNGVLQSILHHKMSSFVVDFLLFGSPAMLIIGFCTTNGEIEKIVSPFSEWIIKNLGT